MIDGWYAPRYSHVVGSYNILPLPFSSVPTSYLVQLLFLLELLELHELLKEL